MLQQRLETVGMLAQKVHIELPGVFPQANHRQGDRQVGARENRQVEIDLVSGEGLHWIDHRDKSAILFRLAE